MDKSPDAFRTISEVADALETPAHVLRFWETRFPQIRPVKRAGGRRYYRPSDIALLTGIKRLLHDDGLTIRGVQKILREQGIRHVAALGEGDGNAVNKGFEPFDMVDDTDIDDGHGSASEAGLVDSPDPALAANDLWPDAALPPKDDDGTLVLHAQIATPAIRPVSATPTPPTESAGPDDAAPHDLFDVAAADTPADLPSDQDDRLIAAVLQTAADPAPIPPPRTNDGWRSLPLAAGEDMPIAARLRALPRGALVPRSAEVAAWTIRARALTQRMRGGGLDRQDGSPPV